MFRDLEFYKASVRAFCGNCEPEGTCHDPDCSLREVSPLPLVELSDRPMSTATPYDREAGLRAFRAGGSRSREERWHGEHGEENREAQSRHTAAQWAALTPEERAARGANIAAGRRQAREGA
jgi:hypothetical protein